MSFVLAQALPDGDLPPLGRIVAFVFKSPQS
jgi:hypothetical protein